MTNEQYKIVNAIKANTKRMAKITTIKHWHDQCDKATKFVIAECQAQHIRLNEDEMIACAVAIVR